MGWIHMVISIYSLQYHCEFPLSSVCATDANFGTICYNRYLLFTDYCIYWIHRWLHIPFIYKFVHKPHHKWISAFTSYSSLTNWY